MGSYHANRISGLPFLANGKGDDGGSVLRDIVFATGFESRGPRARFLKIKVKRMVKRDISISAGCLIHRANQLLDGLSLRFQLAGMSKRKKVDKEKH